MDGSQLSFNIALNDHTQDFVGGGTGFPLLGDEPIHVPRGFMLAHPSKTIHQGIRITKGRRYVLIGFVYARPHPDNILPTLW